MIDDKTGEYARLVKFRLGNTSNKPIIIERICLEVLESETGDFRPSIEGLITPYRYDVELRLADPGEYTVTEDKFKLSKDDMDDFEVLCTAMKGLSCRAMVKVYYTRYLDTETLTECSALLHLTFPEGRSKPKYNEVHKYIVAESLGDNLGTLVNYRNCLPEGFDGELMVYLVEYLSDVKLQGIQHQLITSGVTLLGPVHQSHCCLFIRFKYDDATLLALSNIEVLSLKGWQLIDSEAMKKYEKYGTKEVEDVA